MKLKYFIVALAFTYACNSGSVKTRLSNGDIMVVEGDSLKGVQRIYSSDNILKEEQPFVNGVANGTRIIYFPNGKVNQTTPSVNGFMHGVQKTYNQAGVLLQEVSYKDGYKDGVIKAYYLNGKLKAQTNYLKGRPAEGLVEYDPEGKMIPQPKISVVVKNTVARDNTISYFISLQPEVKEFYVYASFPADQSDEHYSKVKVNNGVARYNLQKDSYQSLFGDLAIYAEYVSHSGLRGKIKTKIHVSFQ